MIYLDNAATTKPCPECRTAVARAMENSFGNASSLHGLGTDSLQIISRTKRTLLSALSGTKTPLEGEIIFTSGATESNNTALLGSAHRFLHRSNKSNKIVTTAIEHPSVAKNILRFEEDGYEITRLAPKDSADFVESLVNAVDENTVLLSAMAVNNETGFAIDIPYLYKEVKRKNPKTIVHVDAVQGFLKVPLDGDLISVSGHKVHSTKGIGALYIKKGEHILPLLSGGGQQHNLRSGTEPIELIAGFEAAIKAYKGTHEHFSELKNYLLERLSKMNDIGINSKEDCLPNIVNFSVRGVRSEIMLHSLEEGEIYVSNGSACSKGKKSEVLTAFGVSDKDADCAVRVSFCAENTAAEVDALCNKIEKTIERVRR
ncbi:MAG: cysteine desulfurase [Oscillospiraceae bacterium]|nr:cysteine desulfurase [Oscillospiraceae bacterium]